MPGDATITNTFLFLDAARCGLEVIGEAKNLAKEKWTSLILLNEHNRLLDRVAPYIFELTLPLTEWYFKKGWLDSWGILVGTDVGMHAVTTHFRKLLTVNRENGEQFYFRFYDPRVLRTFLPICDKRQLVDFFGPVEYFLAEDEGRDYAIEYSKQNGILHQQRIKTSDLFGEPAATTTPN